jgi:hypothetical protein
MYMVCLCHCCCSYLIIVVNFCISDSDSWCRSYTQSLWHERCDPFTNTMCFSVSFFDLLTSSRGIFENLCLEYQLFCSAYCMASTACFILFIWSILFVSGYCCWRLRMSCGCCLAIWQPHVHISLPMCLAKFAVYSENSDMWSQEPKAQVSHSMYNKIIWIYYDFVGCR